MMNGKIENYLIIIEKGVLTTYCLDNRLVWEMGRGTKENIPDIRLNCATVSRKHGRFQNMDGIWYYVDGYGKNGTTRNGIYLEPGLRGRVKPIELEPGDRFIFGSGKTNIINDNSVWGMYINTCVEGDWKVVNTDNREVINIIDKDKIIPMINSTKGTVYNSDNGMAIYMGEVTYLYGDFDIQN